VISDVWSRSISSAMQRLDVVVAAAVVVVSVFHGVLVEAITVEVVPTERRF
jgi:hypothetical protein